MIDVDNLDPYDPNLSTEEKQAIIERSVNDFEYYLTKIVGIKPTPIMMQYMNYMKLHKSVIEGCTRAKLHYNPEPDITVVTTDNTGAKILDIQHYKMMHN